MSCKRRIGASTRHTRRKPLVLSGPKQGRVTGGLDLDSPIICLPDGCLQGSARMFGEVRGAARSSLLSPLPYVLDALDGLDGAEHSSRLIAQVMNSYKTIILTRRSRSRLGWCHSVIRLSPSKRTEILFCRIQFHPNEQMPHQS